MNPEIRDKNLTSTQTLPAQDTSNTCTAIEIGGGDTYARRKLLELIAELPANTILAAGQTLTITPQHSSDNGDTDVFAAIPELAPIVVTGKAGGGMPVANGDGFEVLTDGNLMIAWPCPRLMKSHVRLHVAASETAGDMTALEYTCAVVGF